MISYVAMERIAERKAKSDVRYRKEPGARPFRSDARQLTDQDLLDRLHSLGIDLDRPTLERLCGRMVSAEEVARSLLKQPAFKGKRGQWDSDWIWICVAALWQRWFPDTPSFERLDDRMQDGYELMASRNSPAACRAWLEGWADVLSILDKAQITSIGEFDDRFGGTQSLFNWLQDLESELWNAGMKDRQFLNARIAVGEEFLKRFASKDDLITENWRRAVAESYFELGKTGKADTLYGEWLRADPRWGWGWIGWADSYWRTHTEFADLKRSEQLLRQGLDIAAVRDRSDIVERLADLCEEQGRTEEARQLRQEGKRGGAHVQQTLSVHGDGRVLRQKTTISFEDAGLPLDDLTSLSSLHRAVSAQADVPGQKVGRNDPCPCGSGKKFKKCCGGIAS